MSEARAVAFPLPPVEAARADFYAVGARLFGAPPDAAILAAIATSNALDPASAGADSAGSRLAEAWERLRLASSVMDADAARQEYTDLFVGVGQSPVDLHASHWLAGRRERPLVEFRSALAALGLSRRAESSMYEDHLSAVLETMRMLVAGAPGRAPADAATQARFFADHVESWVFACCDAIRSSALANYYDPAAQFVAAFLALERESFVFGD